MKLKSAKCITKRPEPVFSYKDVPYNAALTFNAGVIKHNGKYIMMFRNDAGSIEEQKLNGVTNIGLSESADGIHWNTYEKPVFEVHDGEINRVYDPRLTVIDGEVYICFAADTMHGIRGGIGKVSADFKSVEILSLSVPDNRNMALFPQKFDGKFVRLERPMPIYGTSWRSKGTFDIWLSESPDLVYWGNSKLVLSCEEVPFCNDKIGPGAPPVKTDEGWLTIFHSVIYDENCGKNGWEDEWKKKYYVGIMLLDKDDPSKVIGMSKEPLLAPELDFEVSGGFRDEALFPCAMILDDNNEVKIYYSAGDKVVCLATADVHDLIALCK